jgi:hypothetical protein
MHLNWQQLKAHWHFWLLGLFVLIGGVLRVWGIGFGLPYIYHYDEHFYINTALKLGAGILNNPPFAPTGLADILFGVYGGYFIVGKALGLFHSGQEFELAFRTDPTIFYLLGRLTSALLGAATILGLYLLGKSARKPTIGLIAAGLLSISFLHVRDSHYAVPDVAMTFFVVCAVGLAALAMRTNQRQYLYLAAVTAGLAMAMKWTALPVAVAVGWASFFVKAEIHKTPLSRLFNGMVVLVIVLFAAGFAFGSPQILANPKPYIDEAFGQMGKDEGGGFEVWEVDTLPGWLFYLKTLAYGLGQILLGLGVIGVAIQLIQVIKKRDPFSILILLFPLIYYLLMGSTRHYFARYAVPLVPFVALFAADTIVAVSAWIGQKRLQPSWVVAVALVVLAMTQPLIQSIQHNVLLTREDTRTLAKEWIENNVPAGAKIALDWDTHGPPLSTPDKPMPDSQRLYEVDAIGKTGLSEHSIAWYHEKGYDYLITSSFIYNIPLVSEKQHTLRQTFYASLPQEVELVQEFRPSIDKVDEPSFIFDEIYGPVISLWQRDRPGPIIRVYKLNLQASR